MFKAARLIKQGCGAFLFWVLLSRGILASTPVVIPEVSLNPKQLTHKQETEMMQTSHITRETIATSPMTNLSDLLRQDQSIVRVMNNSANSSQNFISIRGFGDNGGTNSLILIDGFPLTNPSLLAPNLNLIAFSDIQRVDIFQGSEGTLWGDQAVGGVMNIITRHPTKRMGEVNISLGSFNKQYYSLFAADKFDNGMFLKGFGFTNRTNNYRTHNQHDDNNMALQIGRDYARGTTSFKIQQYRSTTNIAEGLNKQNYQKHPRQAYNFNNYAHLDTQVYQFLNNHELNEDALFETRASRYATSGRGFMNYSYQRHDATNLLNPRLIYHFKNQKMTAGYEGEWTHYDFDSIKVHSRVNTQQNNIYLQDIISLNDYVKLTLGGRNAWQNNQVEEFIGQQVSSLDRVFVTEEGLSFHPLPALQFYLRRDGNFRFAKANEQTWLPSGVQSLKKQTGVSYEAGTEWVTSQQKMQISLYELLLQNEIAFNSAEDPSSLIGTYDNFPRTRRLGFTMTEEVKLTEKWRVNGQFNYVNARFMDGDYAGNVIPAVPVMNANAGVNYKFIPDWNLQYTAVYNGVAYPSQDVENVGEKSPGYWLNNIALQYIKKDYNVSFETLNFFNKTYSVYTLYNTFSRTNSYYPGAGRSYLFTVKMSLD